LRPRRFVGWIINQRGFPALFAKRRNGFIGPEFCFVAASGTKQSRLSLRKTPEWRMWFKGGRRNKSPLSAGPVRLAGPPAAR
jgi:hypothetical protein